MQVKFTNRGSTLVIGIIGELDHHSAEYIRDKIDAQMIKSTTKNIVFDFSKVGFMDSSGIGVIVGRYKNISKLKGKAAIVNPNAQIKKILEMAGIPKIIPLFNTVDDAVSSM
ncbi:anti-sigma F factor antagonist [Clostridium thermosuccinogenes]|uniref:Anti-sigma F factor antagonist n=1 Tax=Clostridium thermosuccinogenes TaxID=84032 RepID=A0A2K2F591_9CLOT|nr:anti-sigma F factor antagonist [Pseudoclostridium thermosuccinogenes]AUS97669.1 anti-sigma F factor antagonist [Pseudoclostridium thermosuccinogenes]PNT93924.1 anti-sigma F factor antagonist [Pseudoclostridium thermosuccinogenes]PNT97383.1 anti-sigma F factor antagonist [Pseudoclostridium thermosuccinogenes]PNT99319.1 anti-sigma F factor antagonist [Pseudoclostridium thermosuccinogenes]